MMMGFELILIVIALGAFALGWRPKFNTSGPAQASQSAVEILKERYARGEISGEEYEQLRRDLES